MNAPANLSSKRMNKTSFHKGRIPFLFQIMLDCAKNPLVIPICTVPGRLADFQNLGAGLENCQKSLNEYLESKRRLFPRFYFISTDELLSILGNSEPSGVQDHMIKVLIYMSTIFLPFHFYYPLYFLSRFRTRSLLSIVSGPVYDGGGSLYYIDV